MEEKGVAHLSKAEWGEVNYAQLSKKCSNLDGTMGGDRGCVWLSRVKM